jgi:NADH-quinone oxidoreductase subunit E
VRHLIPEFERLKARLPPGHDATLVVPCLNRIQEDRGFIAEEDIAGLVEYLGVPRIQIDEVLSFYGMMRRKPVGRWHLECCRNVSCSMRGGERLVKQLAGRLGIKPGETTEDGRYTLSTVECLGSCGTAPVLMVNGVHHENLDPAAVDALLEGLD